MGRERKASGRRGESKQKISKKRQMEDDFDGVLGKTCTWKIRMEEYFVFGWQFPAKFLCSTFV